MKRFIRKQEKAGFCHSIYEINGVKIPDIFKRIGVYKLKIQKKDGFIVSGLLNKSKSRNQEIIQPKKIIKQSSPLSTIVTEKVEQMIGYFNEDKIEDIYAKFGEPSWKWFKEFFKEYWGYLKETFDKEIGMGRASKKERNKIYQLSKKKCIDFLREYFRKKLNLNNLKIKDLN